MPGSPARALVVDDDRALRFLMAVLLERLGLQVTRCAEGESALTELAFADHDLLVTDFHLPGVRGDALIRAARARRPDFPSLLVSGEPEEEVIRELAALGHFRFLPKPFGVEEFLAAVRELLVGAVPRSERS